MLIFYSIIISRKKHSHIGNWIFTFWLDCGGGVVWGQTHRTKVFHLWWWDMESARILSHSTENHTLSMMMDIPPIKALIPFSNPIEETLMGLRSSWMEGGQVLTLMK